MMRRCSVSSFDLAIARELSEVLAGSVNARSAAPLRLTRARRTAVDRVETATPVTSPVPGAQTAIVDVHAAPFDFESWEVFLAWSLELCRARAGFVVDAQGFVVATRGNVPTNQFEGLGAELSYAMEQLSRIDVEAGSLLTMELQFASRRLLAIQVVGEGAGSFVVGFVGPRPLSDEVRGAIMRQLAHSVARLN